MSLAISSAINQKHTFSASQSNNSAVDHLQAMKVELQKQIKQINASKDDSKTKAEKIKAVNEQIVTIDQQIQQAKMEEQQAKVQEAIAKNAEQTAQKQQEENPNAAGVVMSATLSQLVFTSNQNQQISTLSKVRTNLIGESNIAEAEMKQNAALHGGSTFQLTEISTDYSQIAQTEQMIAGKEKAIQHVAKATRDAIGKTDKAQPSSDDQTVKSDEGMNNTNSDDNDKVAATTDKQKKHAPIDITV